MASSKKKVTKKVAPKPVPKMLGTGMAARAGTAITNRAKQISDAIRKAGG